MMLHIANCTLMVMGWRKNFVSLCHECWIRSHRTENNKIIYLYAFMCFSHLNILIYTLDVRSVFVSQEYPCVLISASWLVIAWVVWQIEICSIGFCFVLYKCTSFFSRKLHFYLLNIQAWNICTFCIMSKFVTFKY